MSDVLPSLGERTPHLPWALAAFGRDAPSDDPLKKR